MTRFDPLDDARRAAHEQEVGRHREKMDGTVADPERHPGAELQASRARFE